MVTGHGNRRLAGYQDSGTPHTAACCIIFDFALVAHEHIALPASTRRLDIPKKGNKRKQAGVNLINSYPPLTLERIVWTIIINEYRSTFNPIPIICLGDIYRLATSHIHRYPLKTAIAVVRHLITSQRCYQQTQTQTQTQKPIRKRQ